MKNSAILIAVVSLVWSVAADTQQGDITAAVRGSGLSVSVETPIGNAASVSAGILCDGVLSLQDANWASQRYLWKTNAGPVDFTCTIPDGFVPGEDVVVTAITFAVGANTQAGEGHGYYRNRMPSTWTLDGSNDGSSWTTISTVSGYADYSQHNFENHFDTYEGTVEFHNWKSFRRYRVTVTDVVEAPADSNNYFLQLTEVKLHGLYGGTVVKPDPERIDITAAVRAAGGLRTLNSNLEQVGASYGLEKAFDGQITSNSVDRFLSSTNSTKTALANGGAWISYEIPDAFARGADVIATGYTFDTYTGHGHALKRMPKAWKFQAYDGNDWVTLDSWGDFAMYDTEVVDSAEQYAYTFNFANNVPYRKYRFLITEQNYGDLEERLWGVQFTEVKIWGYVDADIGGTSVGLSAEHPIDLTAASTNGFYTPLLSSTLMNASSSVTNLFNGKVIKDRFMVQLENDPLVVEYTIPDSFLPGREILITNYVIAVSTEFNFYADRMPCKWKLQGWCVDRVGNEGWRMIDSRTDFAGYVTDTSAKTCSASFDLSANVTSCRKYRFVFSEMQALVDGRKEFQVGEIFLSGRYGQNISEAPPQPNGMKIIFR